jgi:hypothetical protein
MAIEVVSVNSAHILSMRYDTSTNTLHIKFKRGEYQYSAVPREVWVEMCSASSIGEYFHYQIKEQYACLKVR